jgi:Lysyl oxidase/Chitobiase/beta-hexosaminidase C-terminal domain/Bacterial pre-peptidase C-terminal domain
MKFLRSGFAGWLVGWALLGALPAPALAQTAASPQVLTNNLALGPLSGALDSKLYYALSVPPGATRLEITISGGPGDADMYVQFGTVPTGSSWLYRPYLAGANETVTVSNPRAGTWYVGLHGRTAYANVTLTATYDAGSAAVAAAPSFNPPPGSYSGQTSVQLATTTPGAVMRYTLNGTNPTTSSEVYVAPVLVNSTTEIRAATFANGYATSSVTTGTFTIRDAIRVLVNGTAVDNLSGAAGSVANFRFAVPAGAASVTFALSGGRGDADLYVKYGQLATTSVWDRRPYTNSNNETVTINNPQAGDYFVMLHGYRAYSGTRLQASFRGSIVIGKPDLTVWASGLNPRISTETFSPGACEIEEGTIQLLGPRKLLRFATQTRNIGTADLVLGNPATNPQFDWGSCHGHYHFKSFAQYRLLDAAGVAVVRTGKKVGFCLMDITRVSSSANPSPRYTCSNQGIQAGWADIYSADLSGQWIDVTGLPAGSYILEVDMDPMNVIDELDEANNSTRVNVTIP